MLASGYYVEFECRDPNRAGDSGTWAYHDDMTRTLTIYKSGWGDISAAYDEEMREFCKRCGVDWGAVPFGKRVYVRIGEEGRNGMRPTYTNVQKIVTEEHAADNIAHAIIEMCASEEDAVCLVRWLGALNADKCSDEDAERVNQILDRAEEIRNERESLRPEQARCLSRKHGVPYNTAWVVCGMARSLPEAESMLANPTDEERSAIEWRVGCSEL